MRHPAAALGWCVRRIGPCLHLNVAGRCLCVGVQEVQEAPKIAGPDALIKQKIKQTRFRWGRARQGQSTACTRMHTCRQAGTCRRWYPAAHLCCSPACLPACLPAWGCREGYAEGLSTTHKALTAGAFIAGDNPIELLGQYTTISVEGPSSEGRQGEVPRWEAAS